MVLSGERGRPRYRTTEEQIQFLIDRRFTVREIRHFHIPHNTPCLPPKILHEHCPQFSWDDSNTHRKWKTKVMQFLFDVPFLQFLF